MPRSLNQNSIGSLASEIKNLCDISITVQESEVTEESFDSLLKMVGGAIDFRSASLFMFSKETGKLEEICTIGRRVDLIDFVEFDMGTGISAWVAQKRRPILLNNLRKSRGGTHTKSFLSVPIVFTNEIMGVINLAHDEPEAFEKKDAEVLSIISTLFALLFERLMHKRFETAARSEIQTLGDQLRSTRHEMSKIENVRAVGDMPENLGRKIVNPLAIIAGNAQFLLMTMKNSSSSVIRRLRAIDNEAGNIMNVVNHYLSPQASSEKDYFVNN